MDLNSKLPRTEVVRAVIQQTATAPMHSNSDKTKVHTACLEELGRVLAWCLLRDATNQTPQPK